MNDFLRTSAVMAAAASTALIAPAVVALAFTGERAPDPLLRLWCNNLLRAAGVRDEVHGLGRLPAGNAVYVCNHQSNFDPVLIYARLGKHLRFIAKRELFKIPIFGAALRATGMIPVDRSSSSPRGRGTPMASCGPSRRALRSSPYRLKCRSFRSRWRGRRTSCTSRACSSTAAAPRC